MKTLDNEKMDNIRILDFMLGLSKQIAEEASRFKKSLDSEYAKILKTGTNNNSDSAIALRETTEFIIILIEDLQYNLTRKY